MLLLAGCSTRSASRVEVFQGGTVRLGDFNLALTQALDLYPYATNLGSSNLFGRAIQINNLVEDSGLSRLHRRSVYMCPIWYTPWSRLG